MTVAMQEDVALPAEHEKRLLAPASGRYYLPLVFNGLTCLVDMASPRVRHGASTLLGVQQWLECARVRASPMAFHVSHNVLHTWPYGDPCDNECVVAVVDYINRGRVPPLSFVQRKGAALALTALRFGVDCVCRYADEHTEPAHNDVNDGAWQLLRFATLAQRRKRRSATQRLDNDLSDNSEEQLQERSGANRKRRAYDADGPYGIAAARV